MSAPGGSSQPPATFSSFINKNTSTKKVAPKAARRRPQAAAAASSSQAQSSAQVTQHLPTPTATQEPVGQSPTPARAAQAAATSSQEGQPEALSNQLAGESNGTAGDRATRGFAEKQTEESSTPRSKPETQVESAIVERVPASQDATAISSTPVERTSNSPSPTERESSVPNRTLTAADATQNDNDPRETNEVTAGDGTESAETQGPRERRTWTTVNEHDGSGETNVTQEATIQASQYVETRDVQGGTSTTGTENEEQQGEERGEVEPTPTQPRANARGGRTTRVADEEEGVHNDQPPVRKPRKPRKSRGRKRGQNTQEVEGQEEAGVDETASGQETGRRKRRRKANNATQSNEEVDGEEGQQRRRKGRAPREPTPEAAATEQIDEEVTFMDSIASRNIRVGRLSERERKMRLINWTEVRQRRREEAAAGRSQEAQEQVDRQLDEAGHIREQTQTQSSGPQLREVDGQIMLVQDSGAIDRQAAADREIEMMEEVMEDDLTTRITTRSFLKNNKRFPEEFLLPGQGKRWNAEDTNEFYRGLEMFGTNFQMIASMFPGTTRRSIKTKFVREERANPQRVKDALHTQGQLDWDHYLQCSQLKDDHFVDADEIKRKYEEQEEINRREIEEAIAKKEEENRQRRLAGIEDVDEAGKENGVKDKVGKGKRGRKNKQVTFQPEEGVEVIGSVDDDPRWGQT